MSNPDLPVAQKDKATLKYFERQRTIAIIMSCLSLLVFLIVTALTAPLFFTNFWLCPILFALLIFTRAFGSWDAYAKMRKQTERMQEDLDNITKAVERVK